ncbi:hypothetical protein ONE63_002471 [Megalurothrips usitatus]|uniref:Uncharacterized protein n=1 Tax=Megalurothrips usitatus TaxID=439358 RepID=A0AAV7X895_9NEOP|nr:hypothetical protein ONE63_002471 [Megalurothrips usitatus]
MDPCQVLSNGKNGSFEHRLRVLTKARGTTLVVNTLPLPDLRAALRCVGAWGRLVHCGDEDSLTAAKIGTSFKNVMTFFSSDELRNRLSVSAPDLPLSSRVGSHNCGFTSDVE